MRLFRSIEEKHGVDQPGYAPALECSYEPRPEDHRVGATEILGSLIIPIAGLVFAIMRFADDEVGPGLACLLTGAIGTAVWACAVVLLT
jgi:hypothetical protein